MKNRNPKWALILFGIMMLIRAMARADVDLADMPKNHVSFAEARKLVKTGKPTYACIKKKIGGTRGNLVNARGAKMQYFASIPKGIDNGEDLLSEGKSIIVCNAVEINENHRFVKSSQGDE